MIAVLFAALSGLSYGASDFSGAFASKRNEAALVTLAMQVVSLLSLGGVLYAMSRYASSGTLTTTDLAWGALGGVGAAIALTTFYKALAEGPMSTAASVTALVGSLVPVITGLVLGEVPNRPTLAGIGLAIPAAIIVSVGGVGARGLGRSLGPRNQIADRQRVARTRRLSIVAGLGFGLFFVALAQASADAQLLPLLGARFASILVLAVVLTGSRKWRRIGRPDWGAISVAGVLDCAANSLYLLALKDGSFTWVAAVVSLYPVSTVLLARIVLNERIARVQVAGLVLAGSALLLVGIGAA